MKPSELRIGNWVLAKPLFGNNKKFEHLLVASPNEIFRCYNNSKDFHPIPLTTEILEKCGFKKWGRDDMPRTLSYELGSMQIFPSNTFCDFDGYGFLHYKLPNPIDGKDESARFKFKHLHQLQNLYYALTGEELNYQP
jgi:hypothetical protein